MRANRGGPGASPELETPVTRQIADQVGRDLHEPCLHGSIAAKPGAMTISAEETVLGQAFGIVTIAQRSEDEPEDSGTILLNHTFKILKLFNGMLDRGGDCR